MTYNDIGFQFPSGGGSTQSSQQSSRYASPVYPRHPADFIQRRYNPLQRYAYPAIALGGAALAGAAYLGYNRMWKNKAVDDVANTTTTRIPSPTPTFAALPTPARVPSTPKPTPTKVPSTPKRTSKLTPRPRPLSNRNVSKFKGTPQRMVWH